MWAFVLDVARRARVFVGVLLNVMGALALAVPIPALAGLPLGLAAGIAVIVGTAALGWALWDQHNDLSTMAERLDRRAKVDQGLSEFRQRLEEGNVLRQLVNRWPKIAPPVARGPEQQAEKKAATERRMAEYRTAANTWTGACVQTLDTFLSDRTPVYTQRMPPLPRGTAYVVVPGLRELRWEVDQKWERLSGLQQEFVDRTAR